MQHYPPVGKGETEAGNLLCAVEGKKTPDFLSWVLCSPHHMATQQINLCNFQLCFHGTVAAGGGYREGALKTPFDSSRVVCQHLGSPRLPQFKTIPPPTSNIHFLEGEAEQSKFWGEEETSVLD